MKQTETCQQRLFVSPEDSQCSIFEQKYLLLDPANQYNRKKGSVPETAKEFC
ncbi:unnamed protein product [Tenebrio molitor]|nr:unnamed protein product [Tenebrio molitor]